MTAMRLSCTVLLAGLLVALPAHADEKKQQTRASPQPVQKQQPPSTPTLPGDGPRLDQAKSPPSGGSAGSLNTGKPMAPAGTQAIGGQATGGSAAAGANLGTTSTHAQPTSGSTLVNPNANNNPAGGAMPGDFSREKKLQGVVDGGAGAVKEQAAAKEGGAPGQQSGANLVDQAGALPGADSGRNVVSKQGQQGDNKDSDKIYDKGGNYLGTRGELTKSGKEQNSGGFTPKELQDMKAEQNSGGYTAKEWAAMKAEQDKWSRGGIDTVQEAERMKAQQEKELAAQNGGTKKTPNPESTTGNGPGMKNMVGTDKQPAKSPAQLDAERKRQAALPNDDKQQVERMKADQRAAGATMAGRRVNTTNPGDQGAVSGGFTGTPKRAVQGGQPENSKGGRTNCPPDSPTC